jgi:hypothetical protein
MREPRCAYVKRRRKWRHKKRGMILDRIKILVQLLGGNNGLIIESHAYMSLSNIFPKLLINYLLCCDNPTIFSYLLLISFMVGLVVLINIETSLSFVSCPSCNFHTLIIHCLLYSYYTKSLLYILIDWDKWKHSFRNLFVGLFYPIGYITLKTNGSISFILYMNNNH